MIVVVKKGFALKNWKGRSILVNQGFMGQNLMMKVLIRIEKISSFLAFTCTFMHGTHLLPDEQAVVKKSNQEDTMNLDLPHSRPLASTLWELTL